MEGRVRSDQTYAAPTPHLRLLLLCVCKVHLGRGQSRRFPKQGDLSSRIYVHVYVRVYVYRRRFVSTNPGKRGESRRHFNRQVRSANDVSSPLKETERGGRGRERGQFWVASCYSVRPAR